MSIPPYVALLMSTLVIFSEWMHVNPCNVATPIAACLGDITTLTLLSLIAYFFYNYIYLKSLGTFFFSCPIYFKNEFSFFPRNSHFTSRLLSFAFSFPEIRK